MAARPGSQPAYVRGQISGQPAACEALPYSRFARSCSHLPSSSQPASPSASSGALGSRAAAARIPPTSASPAPAPIPAATGTMQRTPTMGGTPEQQAAAAAYAQQQAKLAQLLKMKAEGKLTPQQEAALAQFQAQQAKAGAALAQPAPAAASPVANSSGSRIASPAPAAAPSGNVGAVPAGESERAFTSRVGEMRARRPSAVVVQTERKTEFWMDLLEQMERAGGYKMDAAVQNDIIARTLSLQLVLDKRTREAQGQTATPDPRPILAGLEKAMFARLTELNNGQPVRLDPNTPQLERICRMEKAIGVLEARKAKEEEEEAEKVKAKIGELQTSLQTMNQQKEQQRETNRRTMKLELDNLKESMAKMQQEASAPTPAAPQAAAAVEAMAAKMNRLEAALRLLNEERKTNVEDKDTLLLKRKLALFEQKFQDLEAQKSVKASESEADALRDKLLMMEEKLAKMERRKSMSMTTMMQEKMNQVEKQLEMMRQQKGGGGGGGDPAMAQKMALLEAELKKLQNTKITPAMVNDDETNQLRSTVKKIEEAMMAAEKKMEAQRKKVEEERARQAEERRKEELEFREASRKREQELLKRIQDMERKMVPGGADPALAQRLARLETNLAQGGGGGGGGMDPAMMAKMQEMERKLMETQKALEEERKAAQQFMSIAAESGGGGGGGGMDATALIMAMQKQMNEKFLEQQKAMESRMAQIAAAAAASGGGGMKKSGLTYKEINEKLAEIQKQLFDPNCDERTQEQLNIEYEKLITEMEQTDEYKQEQVAAREKWKKDNEPLNQQALLEVRQGMRAMGDAGVLELLKTKPELKLVLRTPDQLLKLHERDFTSLTTQSLTLQEARALYAAMPVFRKEQEKQVQWVDSLKNKIETEMAKPAKAPPPPIAPKKTVTLPKAPKAKGGAPAGDFLAELMQKRKPKD